jgi:hypothetical protein
MMIITQKLNYKVTCKTPFFVIVNVRCSVDCKFHIGELKLILKQKPISTLVGNFFITIFFFINDTLFFPHIDL